MKIVIFGKKEGSGISAVKRILQDGLPDAEIEFCLASSKAVIKESIKDTDALLIAPEEIDSEIMDSAPKLKCIAIQASGYAHVDIKAATERGIVVCPIEEYCTEEVSDHTMALMLALLRNLKHFTAQIEQNIWDYNSAIRHRLSSLTLAIFGFGRIGQAVAKRASSFGIKIIAVDPFLSNLMDFDMNVTLVDKKTALSQADVISVHMNANEENEDYFDLETFKQCVKKPIFINVSRGHCVNEEGLSRALASGYISGAGLDVLKDEHPDLSSSPFKGRENVIITPHSAFYSHESLVDIKRIPCENIINYFKNNYGDLHKAVNEEVLSL